MKKFLGLAAMALSFFASVSLPGSSDAACNVLSALPIRVVFYPSGAAVVYLRPHVISSGSTTSVVTNGPAIYNYYWDASVPMNTSAGAAIVTAIQDAVKSQTKIMIYGDAPACPSTTSNGSIGAVTALVVNP